MHTIDNCLYSATKHVRTEWKIATGPSLIDHAQFCAQTENVFNSLRILSDGQEPIRTAKEQIKKTH